MALSLGARSAPGLAMGGIAAETPPMRHELALAWVAFAFLAIAMIPVIVAYLAFYRQVQSGLTSATLK